MPKFLSFLLLTGVLLQSFSSFVIVAHYEWNKKYITAKFCENKTKPQAQCNGKCHLRKQLKSQTKKEQSPASPLKNILETIQLFAETREHTINKRFFTIKANNFFYSEEKSQEVLISVFHPPCS